jgi:hypothetical protein
MQKSSSASLSFIRHKECLSTSASLQLHIFNLLNYTNTYFIYFDSKFLFPFFFRRLAVSFSFWRCKGTADISIGKTFLPIVYWKTDKITLMKVNPILSIFQTSYIWTSFFDNNQTLARFRLLAVVHRLNSASSICTIKR